MYCLGRVPIYVLKKGKVIVDRVSDIYIYISCDMWYCFILFFLNNCYVSERDDLLHYCSRLFNT